MKKKQQVLSTEPE